MSDVAAFDLLGPLPAGTTVLQASAGTGKTYTIAGLATRYIAEGLATIDGMLLITFGRSATRELRERVRETLTRARTTLRTGRADADAVSRFLNALQGDAREAALARITSALANFDAGTIVTTHSFCSDALRTLGLHADADPGEVLVESVKDIVDEVVDDFYIRKYGWQQADHRLSYSEARRLGRTAVDDPQADLDAGPTAPLSIEETRVAFAKAVRTEVLKRRRDRRLITFDDLVLRLRDALTDPVTGPAACQRLRDTYQLVLVDEFQDTDPAQWTILREAFHGHRTLILIGDPKQAIYAFRGADVFSYLAAARAADSVKSLLVNWRSDAAVVEGVNALMGGLELGDPAIRVESVTAAHPNSRLTGLPGQARVRLRTYHPAERPAVGEARSTVVSDVVQQIVELLQGTARIDTGDGPRPIAPRDIAVLVGKHDQGQAVRAALSAAGVPAVTAANESVFSTDAAAQWATVLAAMQRPRGSLLRDAALTDFFGYDPVALATTPDLVDADVSSTLRDWAQLVEEQSVAQMVAAVQRDRRFARRVLSRPDGERLLTDFRHVASAAHARQRSTRSGVVALHDWLAAEIRGAKDRTTGASKELTRRLETDDEAVQVLTIHTSKGLEFPIAFVPFAWNRDQPNADGPLMCHNASGRRVLDVRGDKAVGHDEILTRRNTEDAGESLRLLYVALTRASSLLVVHWSSSKVSTGYSPLHRALCARAESSGQPKPSYAVGGPPPVASPWVDVQPVTRVQVVHHPPVVAGTPDLAVAPFTRAIDEQWRRTSYSGLTRAVHEAERSPLGFRDDEPEDAEPSPGGEPATELPSPFADLPAGAAFGTLVHGVLEVTDTSADDLLAEVTARCREQLLWHPVADVTPQLLAPAVVAAMSTPLGALAADCSLAQFAPADRLSEMEFELPLGGRGTSTVADLARLLRRHLGSDDPLVEYPDRLEAAGLTQATLRGFLTGSIDAVLRTSEGRYLVCDYKTNLLRDPARPGAEALVSGYLPARMAAAMMDAHYPLQALLYSAALHRFLRWRLPAYDPDRHLGGVLYLFVRGMAGPQTPQGCGVFAWLPPSRLIEDLSDLLDGRVR